MSEAAGRKLIQVGGHDVVVKELTVGDVRALLNQGPEDVDVIGDFLFADLRLRDLVVMTSLAEEQLEALLPSQVQEIVEACRSMNRHFFELMARLNNLPAKP